MRRDDLADLDHLRARALEWIAGDPDPVTRGQLRAAVDDGDVAELRSALQWPLAFGTAGLRGPVGPGPGRMNRATVIRTTRGLADHVLATVGAGRPVVVGFDARPDSERFARDVAGVLVAAGLRVRRFAEPVPTPLVAYGARVEQAAAAVVVTASHNPPADNGYKVYGPDARQIVPPADAEIAAAADAVGAAVDVPFVDPEDAASVTTYGGEIAERYLAELAACRPVVAGPDRRIVYTPLHGVAGPLVVRALEEAGYADVHVVASQYEPDGTFPTVDFPNPEEPGAMVAALDLAGEVEADLVLANDPDGDRLAVAVPWPDRAHRMLTGNQLGIVLGDHLLRHGPSGALVVSSVVSSPMLADVAAYHGARHEATLTGFKWICRAAATLEREEDREFVFGYEEALGYVIGGVVRDKDGIGAAVVTADLVRDLAAAGESLVGRLAELYRRHGLWVSRQRSVRLPGIGADTAAVLDALAGTAATTVGGHTVTGVRDHRRGGGAPWRPAAPIIEVAVADGRALLRPSGTEPKVKVYVDLRADRAGPLDRQEAELTRAADDLAAGMLEVAGVA